MTHAKFKHRVPLTTLHRESKPPTPTQRAPTLANRDHITRMEHMRHGAFLPRILPFLQGDS
jgi:hypothetical protein